MAIATRRVSIANPARRRKMSAKQIRFFGTKRQKAGLKTKRKTAHRRRTSPRAVRRNLGEQVLLTLGNPRRNPGGAKNRLVIVNPGERMAKGSGRVISGYGSTVMNGRRKPASKGRKNVARRRTETTAPRHHKRRSVQQTNPRRHYSARRHNRVVRHNRRRNPMGGSWGAEITHALYIIAGAIGSKLGAQMVLGTSNTGFMGYGANLAAGGILAWAAKGIMKNSDAAKGIFAGSVVQVVLRLITDYTPFGQYASLQGVGDYMASNWVTPQRYVDGLHSAQIEIPDGWGPAAPTVMASSGVNANAVAAGSDGMGAF
jgi:hypothetical protein